MTQHQYYANDWQYDRDHGSGSTYVYIFTTALVDRRGKFYFAVFMHQQRLTDSPRSDEESVPEQRPMVITPLDGSAVQQNSQRHCHHGHELSAVQMR